MQTRPPSPPPARPSPPSPARPLPHPRAHLQSAGGRRLLWRGFGIGGGGWGGTATLRPIKARRAPVMSPRFHGEALRGGGSDQHPTLMASSAFMFACICIHLTCFGCGCVSGIKCVSVCGGVSAHVEACQLGSPADASQIGFSSPITRHTLGSASASRAASAEPD